MKKQKHLDSTSRLIEAPEGNRPFKPATSRAFSFIHLHPIFSPRCNFLQASGFNRKYRLKPRISLRASGDEIYSSFVEDPEHLGYSPHRRGNGRASFGVVYRF